MRLFDAPPHVPWRFPAVAALAAALLSAAAVPAAAACLATSLHIAPSPRALAMAAAARREHLAFGGQTLDAEGRLIEAGYSEGEDARGPERGTAPWQRVLGYWQAVNSPDGRLPSAVRFGALRPASRALLMQALSRAAGVAQGLEAQDLRAVQTALDRVAVIDTPWSAAFLSWLAREAGLGPGEFVFSEAHADYAGAAWQAGIDEAQGQSNPFALRACDPARTPPRVGDLVCHARSDEAGVASFEAIGRILATRPTGGAALPMHCDVVVAVDAKGFDAVGGNVLQSVTLRRLAFARGTRLLDPDYRGCEAGTPGCVDRHMSRAPWSLLLQWR
ncbi:DUF2272 domain-containing protein [Variovorax sp. JS1663]|uniref:DUF2272 domain-containing protein n=1 Tax=Variovorax sp. JS1663 TaxID=1851577 RepID=UPI000B34A162|nr:DUF2272 domain-containing protein [Variovorax sp. JS1663]OUL98859.1 hypothetical protein A8M77_29210 [Variovorax sp. JS1663]